MEIDGKTLCGKSLEAQGFWLDANLLLGLHGGVQKLSPCLPINESLLFATELPLTDEKRQVLASYIDGFVQSDGYTMYVLLALEADGAPESIELCDRLAVKAHYRCTQSFPSAERVFESPAEALAHDPYLSKYRTDYYASSADGNRRIYIVDLLPGASEDVCRRTAVLERDARGWRLVRIDCLGTGAQ